MTSRNRSPRHRQQGISLIVSLVLLIVATLVALASMRGVVLQSRMSGSAHDRNLAFQAAEAARREAETRAAGLSTASFPPVGTCDGTGLCAQPLLTDTPRWIDDSFTGWQAATAPVPADAPTPEVIIEDQGEGPNIPGCQYAIPRLPNCMTPRFLVSARSVADGRASVLVQSQFSAP